MFMQEKNRKYRQAKRKIRIIHNLSLRTNTEMCFPLNSDLAVICSLLRLEEIDSILNFILSNLLGLLPIASLLFILQLPSVLYLACKETFSGLTIT